MDSAYYWNGPNNYSMAIYEVPSNSYDHHFGERTEVKACNGFDNLISDAGILSLVIGVISGILGLFTFGLSLVNQTQTNFSAYWVGLPTSILTLLGPNAPPFLLRLWSLIGILDVSAVLSIFGPMGDFINFVDYLGNGLGLVSLAISAFATFPKESENVLNAILDTDVMRLFGDYRCTSQSRIMDIHRRNAYLNYELYGA